MLTIEAPLACLRGERFAQEQRRTQIDRELPVEALGIERADRIRFEHRGVVDEKRERPDGVDRARDKSADRGVIGKIGAHHRCATALARDLVAQGFGLGERAVRLDRDRVARAMQRKRDGASDATRAACHQRGLSVSHSACTTPIMVNEIQLRNRRREQNLRHIPNEPRHFRKV